MKNIDRVREFHETYGCFINENRSMGGFDRNLVVQRYNLIAEENGELIEGLLMDDRVEMLDALIDLEYVIDGTFLTFGLSHDDLSSEDYNELKSHAISEADGAYSFPIFMNACVVKMVGDYASKSLDELEATLHTMTILLDTMFEAYGFADVREVAGVEVHRSNMSKLSEEGRPIYRESDGKVLKGPNYFKPNLQQFVEVDERRNTATS